MSREDLADDLRKALDRAVVNDVDPDAIQSELENAKSRVEELQALRGDA